MTAPFRILVVCTGNICRSPMAQVLLTHRLRERLGREVADEHFSVTSAGTYGLAGHPLEDAAARVLTSYGVEEEPFEARELLAEHVDAADLVLGATREHRAAVVTLVPPAASRSFTLREFARLVAAVAEVEVADPGERARALVRAAAGQRGLVRPDHPSDDDVADPYRRPDEAFTHAGETIDTAVSTIVGAISRPGLSRP
jgi:protein-tyrosine phosphatase